MRPSKRIVECEEANEAREEPGGEDQTNDSVESVESEMASAGVIRLSRFFSGIWPWGSAIVDSPFQALKDRIDNALARERARPMERGARELDLESGGCNGPERAKSEKPRRPLGSLSFLALWRRAGCFEVAVSDELARCRAVKPRTGMTKMVNRRGKGNDTERITQDDQSINQ